MKIALPNPRRQQRGYVLLVLLLFVALLSISMLTNVERIEFQIKRDREEELIHRGVQYSRAIRRFIAANGRYPDSLEELESTNNIRYLRKRYKDPITGREFRLLHMEDVPYLNSGTGMPPNLNLGRDTPPTNSATVKPSQPAPAAIVAANETNADSVVQKPESHEKDVSTSPCDGAPENIADDSPCKDEAVRAAMKDTNTQPGNDHPIVGVASISHKETIREFHGQNRYNQWLFIYNPSTDRVGILTTPDQPLFRAAQTGAQENKQESEQTASSSEPGSEQMKPQ